MQLKRKEYCKMENYHKDQEICNSTNIYTIWFLILIVLIFILLIAIAWSLQTLSSDLEKKIIVPLNDRLDALDFRFASIDTSSKNTSKQLEGVSNRLDNVFSENVVDEIPESIKTIFENAIKDIRSIRTCIDDKLCSDKCYSRKRSKRY